MLRATAFVAVLLLSTAVIPFVVADRAGGRGVDHRVYDEEGRVVWEFGKESDSLRFARHYTHRPGHGGGGGSLTDCVSTAYKAAAWRWTVPYAASASSHASIFDQAASTWDAATGATLSGGITQGTGGAAGVQDFSNRIEFVDLGASTTIAVTTTWYYTSTGEAVESDAQYNLHYAWSTDGSGGAMDVLNIATHELGHTFGLDHPRGPPSKIGCLTMYAYGSLGEIQKRTLGDGDILGIRAVYGA